MRKTYILDTSTLVQDPGAYKHFLHSDVIIPIIVLSELDKLKKQLNEAGKNARVAARILDEVSNLGDISTGILLNNDILLKIDASYYDLSQPNFSGFGDPNYGDTQILACLYVNWKEHPTNDVTLVSNDINLRIRAKSRGIDAQSHEDVKHSLSELYTGIRTIVNEEAGYELQQSNHIDPNVFGFNLNPNECVLFQNEQGDGIAMGRKVAPNKVKLLKKHFPWGIHSRNKEQSFAIDLIMDRNIDLVTLIGKAGTGKSLVVLAAALELVLSRKEYDKFVIYRPIQPVGNDIGYLPGPQPLDAKILTPNGWTTMGKIQPNDFVIGSDGKSKKVLKIFPKGNKEVFKITFNDGSSTECCEDHLWFTTSLEESHKKNGSGSVKSLKNIRESLRTYISNANNHKIPLVNPVEFNYKNVIIDPYIMGVLLGEGTLSENYSAYFTSSDEQKKDNIFNKEIKKFGLTECKSNTKFIPNEYKINSIESRLSILQGLMDTNGLVSKDGNDVSYSTTSDQLAEDIKFIVQSLGGIAKINKKLNRYTYNDMENEIISNVVSISLPDEMCPFRFDRKIERYKSKKCPLSRIIVDISSVGIKETKCILVESKDHLYTTDEFILTHNTIEEKLAPWFQAIMDNFELLFSTKGGSDWRRNLEIYQKKGSIEMEAITYIRGRSIPNSIILVDECFPYNQYIATENGKEKIGKLYEKWNNKESLPLIKTFNTITNNFEFNSITHAWNRGHKQLFELQCGNRIIKCTENHKFLTNEGWIEMSKLQVGNLIKTSEPTDHQLLKSLNSDQEQIILGSFLGDGNLSNHGKSRFRLCVIHGMNQEEYCCWKAYMFNANHQFISKNGYSKKPVIKFTSKIFGLNNSLPQTKSICPQWVLDKLDARGLAIWFMDNGSVLSDYNRARISTCSFDEDSQKRIVKKLVSFGIECSYTIYKGFYYINLNKNGYVTLAKIIAPYMHDNLSYKVQKSKNAYQWNNKFQNNGYTVVDSIKKLDYLDEVYDIEVENNHNFIVCSSSQGKNKTNSGLIAHNCQNLNKEDVKTILTRAGDGTKIILTGDIEQIDNSSLDATNNGLTHIIENFKDSELAGHITFTQGERSRLATKAAEIL